MKIVRALRASALTVRSFAVVAALASLPACGGSRDSVGLAHGPNDVTDAQIDADPLALLPSAALVVTNLDARAYFASPTLGPQIAQITEKLMPIGEEAGFSASRDVDRVVAAAYSTQGADVAAVISGRFDAKKIAAAADGHVATKGGGLLVRSEYAGRAVFTVNNVGFTILTPKTALAGTETGIRRALDRIKDGRVKRDLPQWVQDTLQTPGAVTALAADFASQPVTAATMGAFPLPWLQGMRTARILGNFAEPGMHVAGTLSYDDEAQALAGADGLRQAGSLANLVAITGLAPQIQGLDVALKGKEVEYKFAVDDRSLRGLLAAVPSFVH